MFAADPEVGLARHAVDLFAHLVERGINAVPLGLGIFGDSMFDGDARLMEHRDPGTHAVDQFLPGQPLRRLVGRRSVGARGGIDQIGVGDQFGEHHGDGLQRLDLDVGIAARVSMLDAQDTHRAFAADDRHPGKAVEQFFAGFWAVRKVGVGRGFVEVERFDLVGNHPDQPLAKPQAGDVYRLLLQSARCVKFQRAVAQQVDRTDLAIEAFADDPDDLIELALRVRARGHDLVQPGQDGPCRLGGRGWRRRSVGHSPPANRWMCRAP